MSRRTGHPHHLHSLGSRLPVAPRGGAGAEPAAAGEAYPALPPSLLLPVVPRRRFRWLLAACLTGLAAFLRGWRHLLPVAPAAPRPHEQLRSLSQTSARVLPPLHHVCGLRPRPLFALCMVHWVEWAPGPPPPAFALEVALVPCAAGGFSAAGWPPASPQAASGPGTRPAGGSPAPLRPPATRWLGPPPPSSCARWGRLARASPGALSPSAGLRRESEPCPLPAEPGGGSRDGLPPSACPGRCPWAQSGAQPSPRARLHRWGR